MTSYIWTIWLTIVFVAAIAEMMTPTFGLIFVSGAAFIAFLVSLSGISWVFQLIIFGVLLIVCLIFLRPRLNKKFGSQDTSVSRTERLVGLQGYVTEDIDPLKGTGRVFVHGEDWAAKHPTFIAVGTQVIVDGHEGIILTVSQID